MKTKSELCYCIIIDKTRKQVTDNYLSELDERNAF